MGYGRLRGIGCACAAAMTAAVALLGATPPGALAQEPSAPAIEVDGQAPVTFGEIDHWSRIAELAGSDASDVVGQAVEFLTDARWIPGEAAERGVVASDEEVRREFEQTRDQSFSSEEEYREFLRESGYTEDDLLLRIRIDLLSARLREAIEPRGAIPEASLRSYYRKHRRRFIEPARRTVRLVLTRRRATADLARRWLAEGRSWRAVARQLSRDTTTRRRGGLLSGLAKGESERALERAVFTAPIGTLEGPIRTRHGWYVLSVRRHRPARRLTYRAARATIRRLLREQRSAEAVARFTRSHTRRWTARTHCLPGRVEAACREVLARRR